MLFVNFLIKLVDSWASFSSRLRVFSLLIHLTMAILYGLFYFKKLGSENTKVCASNSVLLPILPFTYDTIEELDEFLLKPGSSNVSQEFDAVIKYGFIA